MAQEPQNTFKVHPLQVCMMKFSYCIWLQVELSVLCMILTPLVKKFL